MVFKCEFSNEHLGEDFVLDDYLALTTFCWRYWCLEQQKDGGNDVKGSYTKDDAGVNFTWYFDIVIWYLFSL